METLSISKDMLTDQNNRNYPEHRDVSLLE